MSDLAEFLLARIAEDEAAARATPPGFSQRESFADRFSTFESEHSVEDSAFVDRFNPARVLAECEAKRRIIELHRIESRAESVWHDRDDGLLQMVKATEYTCAVCGWVGEDSPDACGTTGCDTLRLLALPYAGHPDYRDEWRPDA